MPSAELKGKVTLDGSGFSRTLNTLSKQATDFTKKVGENFTGLKGQIAGAFSVAAATQMVSAVVKHAERIKDLSDQYHVTTKEVQELDFAMTNVGLKFEDMGTALTRLGQARQKAGEGDEETIAAFSRMGVTLREIQNPALRNVDLFYRMSEAMRGLEDTSRVQNDMFDLMGKSGARLTEAMRGLSEERERFKQSGALIPKEDLDNIDEAARKLETLTLKMKGWAAPVLSSILENPFRGLLDHLGVPGFSRRGKSFRGHGASGSWGEPVSTEPDLYTRKEDPELKAARNRLDDLVFGNETNAANKLAMLRERKRKFSGELYENVRGSKGFIGAQVGLEETQKDMMALIRGLPQQGGNLNELQRVGAYAGPKINDPVLKALQDEIKELRAIRENTKPKLPGDIF
jgi:hypothetical protein